MNQNNFFISLFIISLIFLFQTHIFAQYDVGFAGVNLRPEIKMVVAEIEKKTGKKIQVNYGEFDGDDNTMLGSSFINDSGIAVVNIRYDLKGRQKKLEAVMTHELLHLQLRVRDFPVFLWSPTVKTAKGAAQDVEQSNVNDLLSLIEHRIFKAEMEKAGLDQFIDLAGDTAAAARGNKGKADSQSDSLNYARAILEYSNPADIEEVRKIYAANGWSVSLRKGKEIADTIKSSRLQTPQDAETVFLKCLIKLYLSPGANYSFKFTADAKNKFYRQIIINTARLTTRKR